MITIAQPYPSNKTDSPTLPSLTLKNKSMSIFEESGVYINCKRIFYAYHEIIPNVITLKGIESDKAIKWFEEHYKDKIIHNHVKSRTLDKKQKGHCINTIYVMTDELLVDIENDGTVVILFTCKSESPAKDLETHFRKFIAVKKGVRNIYLLTEGHFGLDLLPIKSYKPKLQMSLNYNDDLMDVHSHLLKTLNKKNKSGLVLLYGIPGTGKTTYIRYLIHNIKKKVIFLPPKIAGNMDSPAMTSLLVDNPNSIFIIEDAEELIKSRENNSDSNISMLLNLTDGMLGESLGIQVICSFNTNVNNIDKALLRKGRLIAAYEFKELEESKSRKLLEQIGCLNTGFTSSMTLSDIYNYKEKFGMVSNKQTIGFI